MIKDSFEQSVRNPNEENRLAIQLRRLFEGAEDDGPFLQYTEEELDDIDEWPLLELTEALETWHSEQEFDRARDALDLLDDSALNVEVGS